MLVSVLMLFFYIEHATLCQACMCESCICEGCCCSFTPCEDDCSSDVGDARELRPNMEDQNIKLDRDGLSQRDCDLLIWRSTIHPSTLIGWQVDDTLSESPFAIVTSIHIYL